MVHSKTSRDYHSYLHGRDLPKAVFKSGITLADILTNDHNATLSIGTPPSKASRFTPIIDLKPASPSPRSVNIHGIPAAELLISSVIDGNLEKTKQLLRAHSNVAVNYRKDGYTALELSVLQQEVEIFKVILNHPLVEVDHALLLAVTMNCSTMVEQILLNVRDYEVREHGMKSGRGNNFKELVVLALTEATKQDKWDVVEGLLQEPYRLDELQNLDYGDTKESMRRVELVLRRITEYQIVCSPVYMALDKHDPILTAFIYSRTLRYWANCFSAFKWQFETLASQVDQFAVDLLSLCRTTEEVELLLQAPKDELGEINKNHVWARLSLAVSFQQQMFVANPLCQHVVHNTWSGGLTLMGNSQNNNISKNICSWIKFAFFFIFFAAIFPILPLVHSNCPRGTTLYKKCQIPCIKLIGELIAYLWFLGLVMMDTFKPLETFYGGYLDYVIVIWIVAMLVQKIHLYRRVGRYVFVFWVNLYDIFMGMLYLLIFTLEHGKDLSLFDIKEDRQGFSQYLKHVDSTRGTCDFESGLDLEKCRVRRPWTHYILIAEACSAIFNMMACLRLLYLFQITAFFGPLQVSLVKMIKDILRFFVLFTIVLLSFAVGLYKLYSSYKGGSIVEGGTTIVQDETFVSFPGTMQALFWSLFGLVDLNVANLVVGQYNLTLSDNTTQLVTVDHYINEALGHCLWGIYHLVAILVLLNVLIATMNESFVRVQNNADSEWKFARTQVYLLYMEPGETLPPPFNLLLYPIYLVKQTLAYLSSLRHREQYHQQNPNFSIATKERYELLNANYLDLLKALVKRYRKIHEQKVKTAEAVHSTATPLLSTRASGNFKATKHHPCGNKLRTPSSTGLDSGHHIKPPRVSLHADLLRPGGSISHDEPSAPQLSPHGDYILVHVNDVYTSNNSDELLLQSE